MRNGQQSCTGTRILTRKLAGAIGALLLMLTPLGESVAAEAFHNVWHFIGAPDSMEVDTILPLTPAIQVNVEGLYALLAIGVGVNVNYRFFRTGSSAGITAGVRGFFAVQSIATFGGHSSGSETSSMIGSNLQLGAYVGNFEVNVGAGIGSIGSSSATGPATDISVELLFRFGNGPLALILLGRIFVMDWDREYYYTDNALGYGGLGLRYQF